MFFYQIVLYEIDFGTTIIQCLELAYFAYREYYFQFNGNIKSLPFYILPQLQLREVRNQGFFFFLVCWYNYCPTCSFNKLCLQKSFFLASQSIPIRVLNGCQIGPRTLFYYLIFLALTLPRISLRKVSLKIRLAQYYYQNICAFSNPLAFYQMGFNSLLYPWRLKPLI